VSQYVATATLCEPGVAAIDLDSVLLKHESADGTSRLGRPLRLGLRLCRLLKRKGYKIVVLTARPDNWPGEGITFSQIKSYLYQHGFRVDHVTNVKPVANFYFDDRAVRVPKNWL
jgi:hypothetical protein